jgi:hypothetical protein
VLGGGWVAVAGGQSPYGGWCLEKKYHPQDHPTFSTSLLTILLCWSWRRGLNPRPSDYKSDALPTELRQHFVEHCHAAGVSPRSRALGAGAGIEPVAYHFKLFQSALHPYFSEHVGTFQSVSTYRIILDIARDIWGKTQTALSRLFQEFSSDSTWPLGRHLLRIPCPG